MHIANKAHRDLIIRYLVGRGCSKDKLLTYTYSSLAKIYTDAIEKPEGIPSTLKGVVGTMMTQHRKIEFLLSKGVKQIDIDRMTSDSITASYYRHGGKPGTLHAPRGVKRPGRTQANQLARMAKAQPVLAVQPESVLFEPVSQPKEVVTLKQPISDLPKVIEVLAKALIGTQFTVYTNSLQTTADTQWSRTKSDKYLTRQELVTITGAKEGDRQPYVCFTVYGFNFELMLY